MEHSYLPPGASLPGYSAEASLAQLNDSSQIPFYAIFAPATYPESVAFWHDPPVQQHGMSAFGGLPMSTPQPAQSAVDQKKHKRTRSGCFTCRSRRVKVSLFSLSTAQSSYLTENGRYSAMKLVLSVKVSGHIVLTAYPDEY